MADIQQEIEELEKKEEEIKQKQAELESIKSTVEDYENKKIALEKELERIKADLEETRRQRREKDETFQEKFRAEQLEKAKQKFFANFKYSDPESQKKLLETFEKIKGDSVDADLIYQDLVRAHLVLNPEKYINLEKKVEELAGSAEEFLKGQSSSAFVGISKEVSTEEIELTPEDREAIKFSGIPEAAYRELKKRGRV